MSFFSAGMMMSFFISRGLAFGLGVPGGDDRPGRPVSLHITLCLICSAVIARRYGQPAPAVFTGGALGPRDFEEIGSDVSQVVQIEF